MTDKGIIRREKNEILDPQKYPRKDFFTPDLKPTRLTQNEIGIKLQTTTLPEGIETIEDAIKSQTGYGDLVRQALAMGTEPKLVTDVIKLQDKNKAILRLLELKFIPDRYKSLVQQINTIPERKKLITKLRKYGLSERNIADMILKPIQDLPSLKLPKKGVIVEVLNVTGDMSGIQSLAVRTQDGKEYKVLVENFGVRQIIGALDKFLENVGNNYPKPKVELFPAEFSSFLIGGFNFIDPKTGEIF